MHLYHALRLWYALVMSSVIRPLNRRADKWVSFSTFFVVAALLFFLPYTAAAARRPATPTATATPTAAPAPADSPKQCCFCVYPDPGSRDSAEFGALCNSCLASSFERCDVSVSVPSARFTDAEIRRHNCRTPVNIVNLQHGPDAQYIVDQVRVCQSALPGCSVNINDWSCRTFSDPALVAQQLHTIQRQLGGNAQVNVCGSRSVTTMSGCKLYRQSMTLVISPSAIHESVGPCQPVGSVCSVEPGESGTYQCVEPNTDLYWYQRCCLVKVPGKEDSELGVWGPLGGGCALPSCDADTCPPNTMCNGDTFSAQACAQLQDTEGKTSACVRVESKCSEFGKSCVYRSDGTSGCGTSCSAATCPASGRCSGNVYTSQRCTAPTSPEQGEPSCASSTVDCGALNKRCMADGSGAHCVPMVTPTATVAATTRTR